MDLANATHCLRRDQPATLTDATLEMGLPLPRPVGLIGFGEVCVNVVPAGAAAATPAA